MNRNHRALAAKIVLTRPNQKTRRFRGENILPTPVCELPTSAVYRLTAPYVPFIKHNRQVDYEKVAYTL